MADKILIGHSNMDLDCFGSMAMARYLYPEHQLVRSGRIHPVAKNLYTIYREHLSMISAKELKTLDVSEIVVLDTRQFDRVKEYFRFMPNFDGKITVYDHHDQTVCDLKNAEVHSAGYGSNTSMMALMLRERNIAVHDIDATIALAGIYADTGNFTHESVTEGDFAAASYLLHHGASLTAVRKLLSKLREDHQMDIFHQLLNALEFRQIHGFSLITSYLKLEGQVAGLAAVIERVFEVEDADAYIAVFEMEKEQSHLLIGRAGNRRIDLNLIMNSFGGAGHPQAASALVKNSGGFPIYGHLVNVLNQRLNHALTSIELMGPATTIPEDWNLLQTALHLEETNNSGAPVIDKDMRLTGMITLRDIQKGRRAEQMNAPVTAYMTRKVISADNNTTIRQIEKLFYQHDIGHLPIVQNDVVVGMVTRSDYLRFLHKDSELSRLVLQPEP